MEPDCEHTFYKHVGLTTSFGRIAWVPIHFVIGGDELEPRAWFCTQCGEQGYEVPA